jgi:SAM-dependent methyltransferase
MKIEDRLDHIYSNRFSETDRRAKRELWRTLCDAFFGPRYVRDRDTVLDIGAGYCDFINNIHAAQKLAVDLNPDTRQFAAPGVEVHALPLERMGEAIEPASVDLAFASNVFEHVRGPDALFEVLAAVLRLLKPGGRLVIMQPNVAVVGGRFWDFCDHTCPLTERGMCEALEVCGFEIAECKRRFLPYTTKSRLPKSPWLVKLYLSLPPAQWLFGAQMLVVARRPLT